MLDNSILVIIITIITNILKYEFGDSDSKYLRQYSVHLENTSKTLIGACVKYHLIF